MPELHSNPSDLTTATASSAPADGDDALAHLARMSSTGSAYGASDYAAISATAIAVMIFGALSAIPLVIFAIKWLMTLIHPDEATGSPETTIPSSFVPVLALTAACAALVLGIIAFVRIKNSNGTLVGRTMTIVGLILALIGGGWVGANEYRSKAQVHSEVSKCAEVIANFSDEIRAEHYETAYNRLMSESFRRRVSFNNFRSIVSMTFHNSEYPLKSLRWNGKAMSFEPIVDTKYQVVWAFAVVEMENREGEGREYIRLTDVDGGWKIDTLNSLFPELKKAQ